MIDITDLDQLETVINVSAEGPVLIFKHSTACPISAEALRRAAGFETEAGGDGPPMYIVKVIEARAVSNAVAERLGVAHQSPQIVLVRAGAGVWATSHLAITAAAIREALTE